MKAQSADDATFKVVAAKTSTIQAIRAIVKSLDENKKRTHIGILSQIKRVLKEHKVGKNTVVKFNTDTKELFLATPGTLYSWDLSKYVK